MTVTFDPNADFENVVDGLEAVTIERSGTDNASVAHALRRNVTTDELEESYGQALAADVRWHLPVVELSETALGDVIIDGDENRYTVLQTSLSTMSKRWLCVCRNLAIAFGLNDTVEIEKATYTKSDSGVAEPAWGVYRSGVRARIQPDSDSMEMEHDGHFTRGRVRIIIEQDLPIDQTMRVRAKDGTLYTVIDYSGAERLGELPVIDAEKTPWQV